MSHAARRRPALRRYAVPTTAALTALTLTAAIAVPTALAPEDKSAGPAAKPSPERTVRGAPALRAAAARTDQIRARQWHLNEMRVTRAWRWSKGSGVTVAVLDTGVDRRHPDLAGRVVSGPDLTGGSRKPGGRFWGLHGTSMASIIAGHGHGPGQQEGVLGVAPQSQILSVRVTWENDDPLRRSGGEVGRNRDAVAQGIRYAVDNGADVINMSLGGGRQFYNGSQAEEAAIKYALSKGVVLIASAGNDGSSANRKNFPAAYNGVIAVGALDRRLKLWKDSNRHPYVAVCAPGVDIVSADTGNGYVVGTGTSPSSAIVAGVAALIRARYPKLNPDQIRQSLVQGSPRRRQATGSATCQGPLDAVRALQAAARLNKSKTAAGAAPKQVESRPVSAPEEEEQNTLLMGILVGGGVLVLLGLILGWRQRRRPHDGDDAPYEPAYDPPHEAAVAMAPAEPPVWQNRDVSLSGTSTDVSVPHATPRSDPPDPWAVPALPDTRTYEPEPSPSTLTPWDAQEIPNFTAPLDAQAPPRTLANQPTAEDPLPAQPESPYGPTYDPDPLHAQDQPYAVDSAYGADPLRTQEQPYVEDQPYGADPAYGADPLHAQEQSYGVDPAYGADPLRAQEQPYAADRPHGADPAYGADPLSAQDQPYVADPAYGADPLRTQEQPYVADQPHGADPAYGTDPLHVQEQPYVAEQAHGVDPSHAQGQRSYAAEQPYGEDPLRAQEQPYVADQTHGADPAYGVESGYEVESSRGQGRSNPWGDEPASPGLQEWSGASEAGDVSELLNASGPLGAPVAPEFLNPPERRHDAPIPLDLNDPLGVGEPPETLDLGSPLYGTGPRGWFEPQNGQGGAHDIGEVPTAEDPPGDGTSTGGYPTFDDEEWERFRRSALEDPPGVEYPSVPAQRPVLPADELSNAAFPAAPPPDLADRPSAVDPLDEDPLRQGQRRPRPSDEDDYRPPWW